MTSTIPKEEKIITILSQIEQLGLNLRDIVEYYNTNNTKPKSYDAFSGKNWASDDDEDDNIYLMDDVSNTSNKSNIQDFITEILNTDENLVSILMTSWADIKEEDVSTESSSESSESVKSVENTSSPKVKSFDYMKTNTNTSDRLNVYNKEDFKEYVNQKINECMNGWNCSNKNCKRFYHIHPDAHCEHTYNGTLCENIINCDKVHIQRCFHEIDRFKNGKFVRGKECTNKNKKCKFIHRSDLRTEEAKQNFDNSIEKYKKKKYKQFFN